MDKIWNFVISIWFSKGLSTALFGEKVKMYSLTFLNSPYDSNEASLSLLFFTVYVRCMSSRFHVVKSFKWHVFPPCFHTLYPQKTVRKFSFQFFYFSFNFLFLLKMGFYWNLTWQPHTIVLDYICLKVSYHSIAILSPMAMAGAFTIHLMTQLYNTIREERNN